MDYCKMTPKQREAIIRQQQKEEFKEFCKNYFTSFGWQWIEDKEEIFVERRVLTVERYKLLVLNIPHEDFPSTKDLKELYKKDSLLMVSPEFSSPWKGRWVGRKTQHTASGINFTYLPK